MDIKFEDLFITCGECGGAGSIDRETAYRLVGTQPGRSQQAVSWGGCKACNGEGGQLTPSGRALKKFINQVERTNPQ